ncbi:hypothetical protein CsatA_007213 [Cannabis sativa]
MGLVARRCYNWIYSESENTHFTIKSILFQFHEKIKSCLIHIVLFCLCCNIKFSNIQ